MHKGKKLPGWLHAKLQHARHKYWSDPLNRKKMSDRRIAGKNPMWKGDSVGYHALHDWIKSRLPKPKKCSQCKDAPALDLANKSGLYRRDLTDWEWLCRKCHMTKDGRMKNLKQFHERTGKP